MPYRKVKFKVNIEKLSFEFEGDEETAQSIHGSVTRALGAIANTQAPLLAAEPIDVEPVAVLEASTHRSAKKRRQGTEENSARPRRSKSEAATAQVEHIIKSGFFAQPRSMNDIRQALAKVGRTYPSNVLSTTLIRFVHKEMLIREEDAQGDWVYLERKNSDGQP